MANEIKVQAYIPDEANPNRHIVDAHTGSLPRIDYATDNTERITREGVLSLLGRHVIGSALSVDRALARTEEGVSTYRTKPVPSNTPLTEQYEWSTE